jgi:hypothetical protein
MSGWLMRMLLTRANLDSETLAGVDDGIHNAWALPDECLSGETGMMCCEKAIAAHRTILKMSLT